MRYERSAVVENSVVYQFNKHRHRRVLPVPLLMIGNKMLLAAITRPFTSRVSAMRWNWQAVLTKRYDRATGTYKYDDWEEIMRGASEPNKHGQSLLERHLRNEEHIKRKKVKYMKKDRIKYERTVKRIDDLISYIKFMKDHQK